MLLVTGGAGFIGSNFVHNWLSVTNEPILNLDSLTYAGNLGNLTALRGNEYHRFVYGSIMDKPLLERLLAEQRPRAIIHFAAESHVDRSIQEPSVFIKTNIEGTFNLLDTAHAYWSKLDVRNREAFRFLHVSTDEVYGSLSPDDPAFTERSACQPNSPYSASKACSDHLVRAWFRTYGLPVLTTHCSNNYGPYQFPEKLVPLTIVNGLSGRNLPVYGDGLNIRDWLYVADHCRAIQCVLESGRPGETYNIGGWNEMTNIEIISVICRLLDELHPDPAGKYERLIKFVKDRLGHDRRYVIDAHKIKAELGWYPTETFESGIRKTVKWYLANRSWVTNVLSGDYRKSLPQYSPEEACYEA